MTTFVKGLVTPLMRSRAEQFRQNVDANRSESRSIGVASPTGGKPKKSLRRCVTNRGDRFPNLSFYSSCCSPCPLRLCGEYPFHASRFTFHSLLLF